MEKRYVYGSWREREIGDDRCTIERDVMRERCRSINGGGGEK